MMAKPTLATVALGGCEGCHVSLLDAHEGLLDLLEVVDLVNTPYTGPDELPDHVDVVLVEGPVETEADLAHLMRAREVAGTLVAMGSCAVLGGIGGLRNLVHRRDVLETAFGQAGMVEKQGDGLPRLKQRCRPVADFVDVDYTVPGCAPETKNLLACAMAAVAGDPYDPPWRNLCDECPRVKDKLLHHTQEFISDNVFALMELDEIDPEACFLEQGVVCMGPMTREGCGAKCTSASVPCRGCMGPSRLEFEQGGKAVDALAAVLPAGALMYMEDLIGTTYRFSLGVSVFPGVVDSDGGDLDA
jgi:F420-non-reducing hydrogenase small subunit